MREMAGVIPIYAEYYTRRMRLSETETITFPLIECPLVLKLERAKNGDLTNQEVKDGYFIDPVLGKCNIKKTLSDRFEAIRKESERLL